MNTENFTEQVEKTKYTCEICENSSYSETEIRDCENECKAKNCKHEDTFIGIDIEDLYSRGANECTLIKMCKYCGYIVGEADILNNGPYSDTQILLNKIFNLVKENE